MLGFFEVGHATDPLALVAPGGITREVGTHMVTLTTTFGSEVGHVVELVGYIGILDGFAEINDRDAAKVGEHQAGPDDKTQQGKEGSSSGPYYDGHGFVSEKNHEQVSKGLRFLPWARVSRWAVVSNSNPT